VQEEVHERNVGTEVAQDLQRLATGARRQAACHPGLLAEQDAKAPVHDVMVVDHEHAQLAFRRG